METKYNLNITTSGENGDNATTTITTSDANKLSDLLKLAGMSQAHPVALNVSPEEHMMPEEEHDAPCSGCGESPCGCGMTEGESWDNEPDEFVHSPEEVLKTGDDLHKVKKSYPPVAGGDNPMALESAENKLRGMYDEFIAESEEEVEEAITAKFRTKKEVPHRARKSLEKEEVEESDELVSPWAKAETVNEGHGWMKGYSKYHCKECGCQMHDSKPDCDCKHDCHDESGSWWEDKDGNGVPDVMESAEQQTMETNTMNMNDIRRLAGLKEQPVQAINEEAELLDNFLNKINEDEELKNALRNIWNGIKNAGKDPADRQDDLDRRIGAAAGETPNNVQIPSEEELNAMYPHRAPDGRRLKYPHGDIRNLFHSSPDSRDAGTDVVVPGGRVGKRLIDQPSSRPAGGGQSTGK